MAGINTHIKGGVSTAQQKYGLEALRDTDKTHAEQLLLQLRDHLRNKSGVVRLVHTSKADKDMTFKTASAFKAKLFLDGGKLRRSGEAVADLLEKAGLPAKRLDDFKIYLSGRRNKGLEVATALTYLNEVLQKGPDAAGAQTGPVKFSHAMQHIETLRAETGATEKAALANMGIELPELENPVGEGGSGEVFAMKHRGENFVYKQSTLSRAGEPQPLGRIRITEGSRPENVPLLGRSGMGGVVRVKADLPQVLAPAVYLLREGAHHSEEESGKFIGSGDFHAVSRGHIKTWARSQPAGTEFGVMAYLVPEAAGKSPLVLDENENVKQLNVTPDDLKPMAKSAMDLLKGLGRHGFIHGDIKPENLFWNPETKVLQAIDTDGMTKISKKLGSIVPAEGISCTLAYLNPVAYHPNYEIALGRYNKEIKPQLGLGRDLYAMGVSLLQAALNAEGKGTQAQQLIDAIGSKEREIGKGEPDGLQGLRKANFAPDSVEDFARSCMLRSIEYELQRANDKNPSFDRYDPAAGEHLLNELSNHQALQ